MGEVVDITDILKKKRKTLTKKEQLEKLYRSGLANKVMSTSTSWVQKGFGDLDNE